MLHGRSTSEAGCDDASWPQAVGCMLCRCLWLQPVWCNLSFDEGLSEPMDIANIRNHALKCTCLSVPAKLGVSAEERKFRGYHTSSAGEVVLYYSRDEIADPLRAVDGVIKMVRDCAFFPYAYRWGLIAASPEQARQCRDLDVAAYADVASGDVMWKPQHDEGDVATPQEVPGDEPVLSRQVFGAEARNHEGTDSEYACCPDCPGASRKAGKAVSEMSDSVAVSFSETLESELLDGACGVREGAMDLASGLCIRCRGESASSAWKSEGAMTRMTPEWSWYAVAIPPLERHRRMECRSAGLMVEGSETEWSKDSDSGRILLAKRPALRRHQNLVKNPAMMMRIDMDR
jgi:hypothetical protein